MVMPDDIRDLRTRLGWSQKRLAEHLGVDQSTVSNWETSGKPVRAPIAKLLLHVAAAHAERPGGAA